MCQNADPGLASPPLSSGPRALSPGPLGIQSVDTSKAREVATDSLSFEEALERLEGIVDRLEQGDLELEDALGAFEKGVALTRRCAGQLEDAERRIEVLVKSGGKWLTRPFDENGQGDGNEDLGGASDGENAD